MNVVFRNNKKDNRKDDDSEIRKTEKKLIAYFSFKFSYSTIDGIVHNIKIFHYNFILHSYFHDK